LVQIFESICSRSDLRPDSVWTLPIGGEFSLLGILLISPEDEVANFEFSFYYFLVVTSGYFCFSVVSRKAASLLTSSTNSSFSRKLAVLAGKSVSASVR